MDANHVRFSLGIFHLPGEISSPEHKMWNKWPCCAQYDASVRGHISCKLRLCSIPDGAWVFSHSCLYVPQKSRVESVQSPHGCCAQRCFRPWWPETGDCIWRQVCQSVECPPAVLRLLSQPAHQLGAMCQVFSRATSSACYRAVVCFCVSEVRLRKITTYIIYLYMCGWVCEFFETLAF